MVVSTNAPERLKLSPGICHIENKGIQGTALLLGQENLIKLNGRGSVLCKRTISGYTLQQAISGVLNNTKDHTIVFNSGDEI